MFLGSDVSASIFDQADLRVLRSSYLRALGRMEARRTMTDASKDALARLVFSCGRERIRKGAGLRDIGTEMRIAEQASAALDARTPLALCA